MKTISGVFLAVLVIGILSLAFNVKAVEAFETIYIRGDGSVDPSTAPIQRDGDVYTLTDNISSVDDGIVIERDNMILDGAGYTLHGTGYSFGGIIVAERSNVTIKKANIKSFNTGISIGYSSNNIIIGSNIANNSLGIELYFSCNNSIFGNNITNNRFYGIAISSSSNNNSIVGNNITNSRYCIQLVSSENNSVSENTATNSVCGISIEHSSDNMLKVNNMSNNYYNFKVDGMAVSDFINDVDASNTVDGKPVCYWVNRHNEVVPQDVGYVAVVNSTGITVKNLNLTNNGQGMLLAYSTDISIRQNNITNNHTGIYLLCSSCNTVTGNNITKNGCVISLLFSSGNSVTGNNMTDNLNGILFSLSSNNNSISRNNVANNGSSIYSYYSSDNKFYNNNFMNNPSSFVSIGSTDFWDDGYPYGGNYWRYYNGTDSNHDGIGDTPYLVNAKDTDSYPLMGTFLSFNTSSGYAVNVITNSSITDFEYFEFNQTITAYVSNATADETFGFCRICIPHTLMNASEISVVIDDGLTPVLYSNYTLYDDGTNTWIYFAYEHSTHKIDVLPEFPTFTILPILMATTLLANILRRRENTKTKHNSINH